MNQADLIFVHGLGIGGEKKDPKGDLAKKKCPEFNYLTVFVTVYVVLCSLCTLILFFVLV